jgi:ribosomal-protein-alanine N-acetyltransferase
VNPSEQLQVERLHAPVTAEDRAAVIAIEAASFANPWTEATLDGFLQTPVSHLYVARLGASIVAFCACWAINDELHINTVAVDAVCRRQGIAYALLREVLERSGARRATLEVRRSNAAAVALYAKLGFEVTAVRTKYYQNPEEDGLILWRNP